MPTSTLISHPVADNGLASTLQVKQALPLPSAARNANRLDLALERTMPAHHTSPDARQTQPLPYSLKPNEAKRLRPLTLENPGLSPAFTHRKNAWNAMS